MKPRISIVVPAYNEEKNIVKCLDCLLNQNYPKGRYEVIVIDDGSRDDTAERVKEYLEKYDNVVLVRHGKNKGVPESLNTGIQHANGEIIWKLDADCEVSENSLQVLDLAYSENPEKNSFNALVYTKNKKRHIAPAIRTSVSGDPKLGMISFKKRWFLKKIGKFTRLKGTKIAGTRITGAKIQQMDGVNPLRKLKVYEKSPESVVWLIERCYHAGVTSLGFEKALGLSILPLATLVIALSVLIHLLFILVPLFLYFFQALKFYQKFPRKSWFGQFLLIKPLTHVSYSLGVWRSLFHSASEEAS